MLSSSLTVRRPLAWKLTAGLATLLLSMAMFGGTSHASRADGIGGGTGPCTNGAVIGTLADGTTVFYCL